MEPVGASNDLEVWKWVLSVVAGAFGGILSAVMAASRLIYKLNDHSRDIMDLKEIVYRPGQGLNILTKDEHQVLCETTFELWGKDFEHIKEKFDDLEEKVDDMAEKVEVMVSTGKTFETHAKELVDAMHDLLKKIDANKENIR